MQKRKGNFKASAGKFMTGFMAVAFIPSMFMLDSESNIPAVMMLISGGWLLLDILKKGGASDVD